LPIGADRVPSVAQSLLIGVSILRYDGRNPVRMFHGQTESGWGAIVEGIDREAAKPDHLSEAVNSARDVLEGVVELGPFWHVRLPKPGQIGGNHMKSIGEPRNEIAEHVARSWKAVQQKECRSVRATRLPVEDFDAVDGYPPVGDVSHFFRDSWVICYP